MIAGLLLALSGKRYEHIVSQVFGAVFVFESLWAISWALGWLETTIGQIITLSIGFAGGLFVGEFLNRRHLLGIRFAGFGTGFLMGVIVYVIVLALSGF